MKKRVIGIVALLLVVAVAITVGVGSSGFTNWNVKTWFKRQNIEQPLEQPDNSNTDTQSVNTVVSVIENNGIELFSKKLARSAYAANGISTQSDSAYVLTATISPADTTDKSVDWSVSWVNADSAFANGKTVTDYVTITPTSSGALTANLVCKQAFGEQIVLTVVSCVDENIKATATVDYYKKLESVTNSFFDGNMSTVKTWDTKATSLSVPTDYTWSVGTIANTVTSKKMQVSVNSALATKIVEQKVGYEYNHIANKVVTYTNSAQWKDFFVFGDQPGNGFDGKDGLFSICCEVIDYGEYELASSAYNKLLSCLRSCPVDLTVKFTYETTVGISFVFTYNVNILDSSIAIMPSSITLNNSSIVF